MTDAKATPPPGLPLTDNGRGTGAALPHARRGRARWLGLLPLLLITFFAGGFVGLYFQPPGLRAFFGATGLEPGAGTDTPFAVAVAQVSEQKQVAVVSEGDIVALGRIIPNGDVIRIAAPFGAGDARIAQVHVEIGQAVAKGDALADLDNRDQLQNAVDAAAARVKVSEAALAQTRASIRASRDEAQAALERAETTAAQTQTELERATSLLERGVTTRADFDAVVARATEAQRDVERNRATLSRYDPASGGVQADIAVAEANLEAARVDLARARSDLDQGTVVAPIDGTVLDINTRVGERPGADGILDMGDTAQMTVEAEVYQTLIGRVAIGDPVTVTAEALDGPLTGTVQAIGLEIGRQSITSEDPAANTDARVVDVIVWLDAPSTAIARRYTNLQAIVRIDAGKGE